MGPDYEKFQATLYERFPMATVQMILDNEEFWEITLRKTIGN